jgi:hypothetical protein
MLSLPISFLFSPRNNNNNMELLCMRLYVMYIQRNEWAHMILLFKPKICLIDDEYTTQSLCCAWVAFVSDVGEKVLKLGVYSWLHEIFI